MGRAPCCDKANVKRGPWSPDEDAALRSYVERHGTSGNWIALPQKAGLKRCGKSCRLRWLNYLRPNINHGNFTEEEDTIIFSLFRTIGSRWSVIASHLPGRTDNAVKNYWNSKLKKRVMAGENPQFNNSSSSSSVSFVKNSPLSSSVPSLIKNEVDFSVPFNSSYTFGTYDQLLPPVFPVMLANRSTSTANEDISATSLSVENWSSNKNNGDDDVLLSDLGIFELSFYSELLSGYDAEVTAPLSYSTLRV